MRPPVFFFCKNNTKSEKSLSLTLQKKKFDLNFEGYGADQPNFFFLFISLFRSMRVLICREVRSGEVRAVAAAEMMKVVL